MLTNKAVIVVGAGASRPYGFPLGVGLVDLVCATVNSGAEQKSDLERQFGARIAKYCGCDMGEVNHFANELRRARPNSLDSFLETRQEFRRIGKAAIADLLLRAEAASVSAIQTAAMDGDWYRYLLNSLFLKRSLDHFIAAARKLTIVTFNFDRVLEWVLYERLQGTFGIPAEQARTVVKHLQVLHVHGLLGEPKWLSDPMSEGTHYGAPSAETLDRSVPIAMRSLRMVDDDIEQDVVEDATEALHQAKAVYFIGFGFDERNLQKLRIPNSINPAATVRGIAFGLTKLERSQHERAFAGRGGIHLYDEDAHTFLRNRADAFFD